MPVSVLHVTQVSDYGVAHYVHDLVTVQLAAGLRVHVAGTPAGWLHEHVLDTGGAWHDWSASRSPGASTIPEAGRLARIVDRVDPDVVHLHSSKAGLAGRLAVRGRRPTIFQPHGWSYFAVAGSQSRLALAWERFAARWTTSILCVSDGERAHGEAAGIGGPWSVVPTGVDTERYSPGDRSAARAALGIADGPVALSVARLAVGQKAQDVLIEAWRAVERDVPDATLFLIGEGPDRAALEAAAPASVRFLGERDDVATWLRAANLVVQPSRYEGLSLSVLEAMACGRSLVVTDCVGMREAVGEAGAVVPVDDVTALSRAVATRLADPVASDVEGAAGRARAHATFSRARWAAGMVDATEAAARG